MSKSLGWSILREKRNITVTEEELDGGHLEARPETHQAFDAVKSRLTKEGATDRIKDRIRNKKPEFVAKSGRFKDPRNHCSTLTSFPPKQSG
jgi:hypothetical protein